VLNYRKSCFTDGYFINVNTSLHVSVSFKKQECVNFTVDCVMTAASLVHELKRVVILCL